MIVREYKISSTPLVLNGLRFLFLVKVSPFKRIPVPVVTEADFGPLWDKKIQIKGPAQVPTFVFCCIKTQKQNAHGSLFFFFFFSKKLWPLLVYTPWVPSISKPWVGECILLLFLLLLWCCTTAAVVVRTTRPSTFWASKPWARLLLGWPLCGFLC